MPRACLWTILASCLIVATAHAQFVVDSWTTENGLPQNSVISIQQTPDGYLWFTTFDGLVRFDGVRFTVFNKANSPGLKSNRYIQLFAERDGTLWASTENDGFVRYRAGRFRTFTVSDGLPSNAVNRVQKDIDGSVLIETQNATAHLRETIVADPPVSHHDRKTYISPEAVRWEIDAKELRRTKDGRETRFPLPFQPAKVDFNDVQLEEAGDVLWLTTEHGLYRLENGNYTAYTAKDGLPQSFIRALRHDREGGLWLATDRDGACRLFSNRFTCYTTADGLTSNVVSSIFQDREGAIWVGTNDRGLNRLTHRVATSLSTAAGLPDKNVYTVIEDRAGDMWVGSPLGLAHVRSGKVIGFFDARSRLMHYNVQGLFEDRSGRLWIASQGGITYYEHGRFTEFTENAGLRAGLDGCAFVREDAAGALWFGADVGLVRYQDGKVRRYTVADGLPGNDVRVFSEDGRGGLWVGTYSGLAHWDGVHFTAWTERDGLASNHIRALYQDDRGTLWIGTYDGGLSRFRDGKFTNFTTARGLFSDGVFHILEDARHNFWMSSNQGIYRVSRNQLEDVAAGRGTTVVSTAFGRSDGMLNAECNGGAQTAGVKTRDGKLWFPTQDGIAIIDPEAVPYNPLPPSVVIESGSLEGQPLSLAAGLRLEPNKRDLEIRYTGLSLVKSDQVRFRYRLEGLDTQWVEAGTRRSAYYPYLPPGHYVFRVIAANSDLVWSPQGAGLAIQVLPPFYRTWWFLSLDLALALAAGWLAWRARIAKLEKAHATQLAFSGQLIESQEAERKRMAGELHDSLGQHLLVIKNRAAIGAQAARGQDRAGLHVLDQAMEQFSEITESASQAIDEVRQIAYNLRPPNLERLGITSVIEELVEKVARSSGIQFSADITALDGALGSEGPINLYRIIQESINNIVKHSRAVKASVEIWPEGGEIHVVIADNGRGFSPESPVARGLGLTSIAERVRLLGGTYSLVSAPERGASLTIRIPAKEAAHSKGAANGA